MTAPTLTEFLLARIADDGRDMVVTASRRPFDGEARWTDERLAKGMIVEAHEGWHVCPNLDGRGYTDHHDGSNAYDPDGELCPTLLILAAIYADHPDYDEEWRP